MQPGSCLIGLQLFKSRHFCRLDQSERFWALAGTCNHTAHAFYIRSIDSALLGLHLQAPIIMDLDVIIPSRPLNLIRAWRLTKSDAAIVQRIYWAIQAGLDVPDSDFFA